MQALLLAAVAWLQLNAGAVKEGVITACFMHALGILFFIDRLRLGKGWIKSILIAAGFAFAVVLATSPHWLLFLDALGKSVTDYDTPGANVYQIWRLAGFFDNFYFQRIDGTLGAPSMNIFVLLCMTGAIVSLHWHKPVKHFGTAILFFLALSVAYGLVPRHILISIPLINNIQHIYNTFSVPMMILALVLAGFGIQQYSDASEKRKKVILAWSLSAFPILCIPYLSVIHGRMTILFSILVFIVIVTGIRQLYLQAGSGVWSKSVLIILACCFILLHIRHGMHLTTGVKEIDSYTQNPTARADFSNKSTAIEFVKNRISRGRSPVRVIAEGPVMFPGYNSMFGLEGIVLVEALRNRHFEKLLDMADYPVVNNWNWLRLIRGDQIESRSVALDLLNAGYVVAAPGTKMPKSMKLVHSSDLDVWERDSVWPRAFFVNQVLEVKKTADIPDAFAKIQTLPFAAVESDLIPLWMPRDIHSAPIVVPARRYTLTNNSTRFSVDASGPGIIVLSETYYPKDFIARLNGKTADYIRVNQAFKGIWVKEAGNYDVSFTYRPARLSLSILLSISGFFLLILLCGIIRSPV